MEEKARDILRDDLKQEDVPGGGLGTETASLFRENGLENDLVEIRGHSAARDLRTVILLDTNVPSALMRQRARY